MLSGPPRSLLTGAPAHSPSPLGISRGCAGRRESATPAGRQAGPPGSTRLSAAGAPERATARVAPPLSLRFSMGFFCAGDRRNLLSTVENNGGAGLAPAQWTTCFSSKIPVALHRFIEIRSWIDGAGWVLSYFFLDYFQPALYANITTCLKRKKELSKRPILPHCQDYPVI